MFVVYNALIIRLLIHTLYLIEHCDLKRNDLMFILFSSLKML